MIALGHLGLHPWEFDEYTMADFVLKLEGAREMDELEWQRMRVIAYTTAKPYLKNKNLSIERFMPLPSDKKRKGEKQVTLADQVKQLAAYQNKKDWTKIE